MCARSARFGTCMVHSGIDSDRHPPHALLYSTMLCSPLAVVAKKYARFVAELFDFVGWIPCGRAFFFFSLVSVPQLGSGDCCLYNWVGGLGRIRELGYAPTTSSLLFFSSSTGLVYLSSVPLPASVLPPIPTTALLLLGPDGYTSSTIPLSVSPRSSFQFPVTRVPPPPATGY